VFFCLDASHPRGFFARLRAPGDRHEHRAGRLL
jgi:hypothetical protein